MNTRCTPFLMAWKKRTSSPSTLTTCKDDNRIMSWASPKAAAVTQNEATNTSIFCTHHCGVPAVAVLVIPACKDTFAACHRR